ncbi:MAG: hypothetical protein K8963_11020, partial [Proteobacteria bacterium]|nr:hypothetical protein [Pseudomonadota bacterium]
LKQPQKAPKQAVTSPNPQSSPAARLTRSPKQAFTSPKPETQPLSKRLPHPSQKHSPRASVYLTQARNSPEVSGYLTQTRNPSSPQTVTRQAIHQPETIKTTPHKHKKPNKAIQQSAIEIPANFP